jgi:hypothetical protein
MLSGGGDGSEKRTGLSPELPQSDVGTRAVDKACAIIVVSMR